MYIWTMVQIYKFFVKRKSDSHKKLRIRPILSPHLLLTPLIPRDFCGGWRGFSRLQPALWWVAFLEGCGGWR